MSDTRNDKDNELSEIEHPEDIKNQRFIKFLKTENLTKQDGSLNWRAVIVQTLMLIAGFLLVYVIALYFIRDSYREIGEWVANHMGYPGIFGFVCLVDMFILPMSVDLLFPFVREMNPFVLCLTMGLASTLGGYCGYWIGRLLGKLPFIKKLTARFSEQGSKMIGRYGVWAIVIAGLTPIPFSTVCWIAGMLKVPAGRSFLAMLSRFPRMAIYYAIFMGGLLFIL